MQNFKTTKEKSIDEIACHLTELVHTPTGAQVVQLANDDDENVFCLSFRTIPKNSNGVAHILEHTVLCGSEKYPVRDPFFAMTRRSLNTYMNALTGSDFTCYPAASQIPKDFYSLLSVYLDAVFHPKIDHLSFLQEGWRLEFEDKGDPSSPLKFKGVVFNEMKGAMASGDSRLWQAVMTALFPDITYGVNSGGEPKAIPTLSYERLLEFHQTHYHPSRCTFYFYGNIPLQQHLEFIEEHALKGIKPLPFLPAIPKQKRFTTPKIVESRYPVAEGGDHSEKYNFAFGALSASILDQGELLALAVLEIVLMGTDAALLRGPMLRSGLCKQIDTYIDAEISEVPIVFIFKGCKEESFEALQEYVRKILKTIIEEGIPKALITAAIHQLEFQRTEIVSGYGPFGLSLFMRSVLLKQHGGEAEDGLLIHQLFQELQEVCEDPSYLKSLIEKYLLNNQHSVWLLMKPDETLEKEEQNSEDATLKVIYENLDRALDHEIVDRANALAALQDSKELNLEVLPKISLKEVPGNTRDFLLNTEKINQIEVFHHSCFTNGIIYADLIFHLPYIPEVDLSIYRLFTSVLTLVGAGGRDYQAQLEWLQEHTGGVAASLNLHRHASDCNTMSPTLSLRGKALGRNKDYLFQAFSDIISSADLTDKARFKELLLQHYTSLEQSLTQSALRYAISLASSTLTKGGRINHAWSGLEYYSRIRDLVQNFDEQSDAVIEKFQAFLGNMLSKPDAHLVITCDDTQYGELRKNHFSGLTDLQLSECKQWNPEYSLGAHLCQGRTIAAPVSFTCKMFSTVPYIHPESPALSIAARLFDNTTLHKRIREQGGAYGSGAVNNPLAGSFYLYSYRDPHLKSTLDAFNEAVDRVCQAGFEDRELDEAKLGIIQGLDSPIIPSMRALLAYNWRKEGCTLEHRQSFRDSLLSMTREQVVKSTQTHIQPALAGGVVTCLGGKDIFAKELPLLDFPIQVEMI